MGAPSTATSERFLTCASDMNWPCSTGELRTAAYSGVTPTICVKVLLPLATTCPPVRISGAAAATDGAACASTRA